MVLIDNYLQQGRRMEMVRQLRMEKDIKDERVLKAMEIVPRHWFMDISIEGRAYEDRALPIACEQTISQPSTVAFQSALLEVEPGMKVLEIGTGSGYQTAVLCKMGARVFTIERQKGLFDKTKKLLYDLHYTAKCFLGDGYQGLTEVDYGPYDRILITCGASHIPPALVNQLKDGGIMVIPVGDKEQVMIKVRKVNGKLQEETFGHCKFVPMLKDRQFGN